MFWLEEKHVGVGVCVRKWNNQATRGLLKVKEFTYLEKGSEKWKDEGLC